MIYPQQNPQCLENNHQSITPMNGETVLQYSSRRRLAEQEEQTTESNPSASDRGGQVISEGFKLDGGKDMWSLLPFGALREVVKVLMMGAAKYAPNNWMKVPNARERYWNASMRHLIAIAEGELRDKESGLLHASHLACNALFLTWFHLRGEE